MPAAGKRHLESLWARAGAPRQASGAPPFDAHPLHRRMHPPPTYQLKPLNYFSHFSHFSGHGVGQISENGGRISRKCATLNPLKPLNPQKYFSHFSHFSGHGVGQISENGGRISTKMRHTEPAKTAKLIVMPGITDLSVRGASQQLPLHTSGL